MAHLIVNDAVKAAYRKIAKAKGWSLAHAGFEGAVALIAREQLPLTCRVIKKKPGRKPKVAA